jgi:hypothetical protein
MNQKKIITSKKTQLTAVAIIAALVVAAAMIIDRFITTVLL